MLFFVRVYRRTKRLHIIERRRFIDQKGKTPFVWTTLRDHVYIRRGTLFVGTSRDDDQILYAEGKIG